MLLLFISVFQLSALLLYIHLLSSFFSSADSQTLEDSKLNASEFDFVQKGPDLLFKTYTVLFLLSDFCNHLLAFPEDYPVKVIFSTFI